MGAPTSQISPTVTGGGNINKKIASAEKMLEFKLKMVGVTSQQMLLSPDSSAESLTQLSKLSEGIADSHEKIQELKSRQKEQGSCKFDMDNLIGKEISYNSKGRTLSSDGTQAQTFTYKINPETFPQGIPQDSEIIKANFVVRNKETGALIAKEELNEDEASKLKKGTNSFEWDPENKKQSVFLKKEMQECELHVDLTLKDKDGKIHFVTDISDEEGEVVAIKATRNGKKLVLADGKEIEGQVVTGYKNKAKEIDSKKKDDAEESKLKITTREALQMLGQAAVIVDDNGEEKEIFIAQVDVDKKLIISAKMEEGEEPLRVPFDRIKKISSNTIDKWIAEQEAEIANQNMSQELFTELSSQMIGKIPGMGAADVVFGATTVTKEIEVPKLEDGCDYTGATIKVYNQNGDLILAQDQDFAAAVPLWADLTNDSKQKVRDKYNVGADNNPAMFIGDDDADEEFEDEIEELYKAGDIVTNNENFRVAKVADDKFKLLFKPRAEYPNPPGFNPNEKYYFEITAKYTTPLGEEKTFHRFGGQKVKQCVIENGQCILVFNDDSKVPFKDAASWRS